MTVYVMRVQFWRPDYHYELEREDFVAFSSIINARAAMMDEVRNKCNEWKDKSPKTKRYSMNAVTVSRGNQEVRYNIYELTVRS